jgi:hypothetical protein
MEHSTRKLSSQPRPLLSHQLLLGFIPLPQICFLIFLKVMLWRWQAVRSLPLLKGRTQPKDSPDPSLQPGSWWHPCPSQSLFLPMAPGLPFSLTVDTVGSKRTVRCREAAALSLRLRISPWSAQGREGLHGLSKTIVWAWGGKSLSPTSVSLEGVWAHTFWVCAMSPCSRTAFLASTEVED